ncbi:MAG: hypothetical protein ARM1_0453 [Candidatus Micrarchaeota archaeon]|nr:MAG: hypothetical protein ARM1_0453 [Candidatus Micrarchaeota archaeon]
MHETRCIICGKRKPGLEIDTSTFMFKSFKKLVYTKRKLLRQETKKRDYTLVVCKECFPTYYKLYRSYRNRKIFYIAILILGLFVAVLSGSLAALLYLIIIAALLFILLLLSFIPKLKVKINHINLKEK